MTQDTSRYCILVSGIVQGVGFRPFVYSLATRLALGGFVANDANGVVIEVEGRSARITEFTLGLRSNAPPLAVIERVDVTQVAPTGDKIFAIIGSRLATEHLTFVSPDIATCTECLAEMFDRSNRRYRYPFINCTNCGPRFTILQNIPYDRPSTTMAEFEMCSACGREYSDPHDRRFHAQPISCWSCGPRLSLASRNGVSQAGDPIKAAAAAIRAGWILAIKGLGGYHLAALAASDTAVNALRSRKHREDKPFAVMTGDMAMARELTQFDAQEERLLTSRRRPIVLLRKRANALIAPAVALATDS